MSKVRLHGSVSGFVDLKPPDVASNVTITLPNTTGSLAPLLFTENVQTGDYTLSLSDVAKVVAMNNSAPATVTVPANSLVAFEVGTVINICAMTAEPTTLVAAAGVTIRHPDSPGGATLLEWSEVSLRKRATDEWVLSGNVA